MGIAIDLGCLLYLLLIPGLGFVRGLRREAAMLAAGLAALGLGWLLRGAAERLLADRCGLGYLAGKMFGFPAAALACYAAGWLLILVLARGALREPPTLAARCGGAVLGLGEAILAVGVLLAVLTAVPGADGSLLVRTAAASGVAAPITAATGIDRLQRVAVAVRTPGQARALAARPEVQEIVGMPAVQELLHNPELRQLAEQRDLTGLARHPAVDQLLRDPDFRARVEALDLDRLLAGLESDTALAADTALLRLPDPAPRPVAP